MARSDNNLTAVFTDTANAIRSKTGGSSQISPRDFADEIATIEVTPANEYKQMLIDLLQDTTVSITIPNEVTSLGAERWKNDSYLTTIDFNNVAIIPEYTCYNCSNLTTVIFKTATTNIGNYAFYGCTKFEDTELPHTLTNIGQYAFYKVGSYYDRGTHTFTMIDNVGVHTTIGQYAFQESHLSEITAYLNNVGDSAFYNCSSLTKVDVEIHGSLGSNAFANCKYVMDFRIDPNSAITSLSDYVFSYLGDQTYSDTNFHMADFDFRKSTFTALSYGVWGSCHFNGRVFLPATLKTIGGNFLYDATGNWVTHFNYIPSVSSSSYLRNDSPDTFTVRYAFPYKKLETVSGTTNWSSHTSQIVGYDTGFEAGAKLPEYERDTGVSMTWYSDAIMTTPVTTSSSATDVYYCSLGSTRLVWFVDTVFLDGASVTISDGVNTYSSGDPIPVDTSLTITPSYTDPAKNQLYLLKVNGTDYTSTGSASITMTQDLYIEAIYWNGTDVPFLPTLSDNPWMMIKIASQNNTVPSTWNIGDTKTFTYNGDTYTARLVDKTGKYKRASNDSTAYLSFEVTELLPDKEVYNSSRNNKTNDSQLLAKMNSGTIWDNMDADLKSALETVKVKVSQGGGSSTENTIIDWEGKLFLPRQHDLFSTEKGSVKAEWDLITQDQYYQANDTNDARRKCRKTSSLGDDSYWEMSPSSGNSNYVRHVGNDGHADGYNADNANGVAVRFAL